MEKILAIISLGQNIYGRYLFRRLLSGVIILASLAVIASALTSMMVVGGFYAAYLALLHAGMEPERALGIIGALGALVTGLFILLTARHLRRLREMPRRLLQQKVPSISQASDVVDAFLNGFLNKP